MMSADNFSIYNNDNGKVRIPEESHEEAVFLHPIAVVVESEQLQVQSEVTRESAGN